LLSHQALQRQPKFNSSGWRRLAPRSCGRATVTAASALLGRAGLHNPARPDWPGVEVGWVVHPGYWGRGYATEAGWRALEYAFEELKLPAVCSTILPDNGRSIAVARRLGFRLVEERTLSHFPHTPHGIWWLQRTEWTAQSAPASPAQPL
jgi:RimJ/RimL family protein N-acetyltransferase